MKLFRTFLLFALAFMFAFSFFASVRRRESGTTSSPVFTFARFSANAHRLRMSPEGLNVIIETIIRPAVAAFLRKILIAHCGDREKSSDFGTSFTSPVSKFLSWTIPWSSVTT